jgi:hypothetical protein
VCAVRLALARAVLLAVGLLADHVKAAVELHVDLAAVVEGDLYLVVALLVADLGLGDLAAARVGERRSAGLVERAAADRCLRVVSVGLVLGRLGGLRVRTRRRMNAGAACCQLAI